MKKITSIEFVNYKAFYGEGEQNKITIPEGKNLLIYGENGSGKTSIFEGLKQFFNSTNVDYAESPAKHVRVPKSYVVNEGTADEAEVLNKVSVKLTFQNDDGTDSEELIYGVQNSTNSSSDYVRKANQLKSFLSYRELLHTYLMSNLKDRTEFRRKFALLLIETILSEKNNSGTSQSYIKSWADFFIPRASSSNKTALLASFSIGLKQDLNKINLCINEFLTFFSNGIEVNLKLVRSEIIYRPLEREDRTGYYPLCEIDLEVKVNGEIIDDDFETHLTVLNEARLSSLAISIYLSALVITPQTELKYKLLFLDDIFIGLDLSNRLPLLKILSDYKKPLFENGFDAQGRIVEKIKEIDGIKQYEPREFFNDYQIFITTYDKYWFEVSKQFLQAHNNLNWHYVEMYVDTTTHNFAVPSIIPCCSKIERAEQYLHKHDYRACATYLRAMCEEELDRILPQFYLKKVIIDNDGNNILTGVNLNDKIIGFERFCRDESIDYEPYKYLKLYKNHLLNTLSHNDISSPIYKNELLDTLGSIKALAKISKKIIPDKIKDLGLVVRNKDGNEVSVRIKKIETQNFIFVENVPRLSAKCRCEIDGIAIDASVVAHTQTEFKSLYDLYDHVCEEYNIEKVHILHEVFHKRVRDAASPRKSLIELIEN